MQDTHKKKTFRELHAALVQIVGVMNRPQRDAQMIHAAGITLDRALFPLIVLIGRMGPIGVGELADRVGRDYSTVSRQVAKLETLGLVYRQAAERDRRVTEASITAEGQAMNGAIDAAREKLALQIFRQWSDEDVSSLAKLMTRFAKELESLD